jgi:RimJ/RimL family protein N-acetyltransferase
MLKKPYFLFPEIPISQSLYYERLNEKNYSQLPNLFAFDPSPYIQTRYKNDTGAKLMWEKYEQYVKYSLKHCGCDWFMRLKNTGEYIGFLNLYDLNAEFVGSNHNRCTIGFQTSIPYRKLGLTEEGVTQLLHYAFTYFDINLILAYTQKDNMPSQSLLKKLKFIPNDQEYYYSDQHSFFELPKGVFDEVWLSTVR